MCRRKEPIIAIGGGVCLDVCGLAANLYRRNTPVIKVWITTSACDSLLLRKNTSSRAGQSLAVAVCCNSNFDRYCCLASNLGSIMNRYIGMLLVV